MWTRTLLIALTTSTTALAVQPSHWRHNSEADFRSGKFDNVVVTNLGDVKLAREVKPILEQDPRIGSVYCLVEAPDGTLYAGTGPEGLVYRVKDGKVETAYEIAGSAGIFAMLIDGDGRLVIASSGQRGRLLRVDQPNAEPTEIFAADGVQYIWALQRTDDGNIYAATGPSGQLFEIRPDGTSRIVLKTDETNFLSLASDGKDTLYVGTDPNGLLYRVNRKTGELFVLYDAAESEISAIAVDRAGNVYAGTAQAGTGEVSHTGAADEVGRPEGEGGVPIPAQPPEQPAPPELPDPNPSEPDPIPTGQRPAAVAPAQAEEGAHAQALSIIPLAAQATPLQAEEVPDAAEAPEAEAEGEGEDAEAPQSSTISAPGPSEPAAGGNAIYRVDPQGFVTEVFRSSAMILSLLEQDGRILVGTGNEGHVYQISPSAEETLILADVEPQQVMCLLPARDGRIYLGTANTGAISAMSPGLAPSGTYTSAVLDASQVARFGKIQLFGSLPDGTSLKVSTRSGNVQDPESLGWSPWTEPADAMRFMDMTSPSARFVQYRLILGTERPDTSPVVDEIDIAYQIPNLPPRVVSVTVEPMPAEGEDGAQSNTAAQHHLISWQAADPNSDELVYELHFRQGTQGPWVPLKDRLREPQFQWNTRGVPDGRYYVRVTASDALANALGQGKTASRVSEAITIDNTPPVIGDLVWQKRPGGVQVDLRVVDRTSTVSAVHYAVNSADDWQAVLPSDTMFDSPAETVSFAIPDLLPGVHQISIRATDAAGNRSFENVLVTVSEPSRK